MSQLQLLLQLPVVGLGRQHRLRVVRLKFEDKIPVVVHFLAKQQASRTAGQCGARAQRIGRYIPCINCISTARPVNRDKLLEVHPPLAQISDSWQSHAMAMDTCIDIPCQMMYK